MNVYIKTIKKTNKATIGRLFVDEIFICNTLEDTYRDLPLICPDTSRGLECTCREKKKGQTCIPGGTYKAAYLMSPKFGRKLLRLIDVPHFIGILIHRGNTDLDTAGCILVGDLNPNNTDTLINSAVTEQRLDELWKKCVAKKEDIEVVIERSIATPMPFEANNMVLEKVADIKAALNKK